MSTTATVTPYGRERQRQLAEEEAGCEAAVERYRTERRLGRIARTRVALNARTMEPLLRAAESLGYWIDSIPGSRVSLESAGRVSLTGAMGAALLFERGEAGRLVLSTDGSREEIHRVIREHVLAQARAHLLARGMDVRVRQLPTGEIQLEGRERVSNDPGGHATVTAAVGREGTMQIDVGCLKGQRCEEIVRDLARAVDGECVDLKRKPEFFQVAERGEEHLRV